MTKTLSTVADRDHARLGLRGFPLIDCDSHFTEPPDLWSSRAAKSQLSQMPVMRDIGGGACHWFLNDQPWASLGGNNILRGGELLEGNKTLQVFERFDPACYSVGPRVHLLDQMGIDCQVVYPNGIGFSSNHMFAIDDKQQRLEILRIFNDFFVDVQTESGLRLLTQPVIPIWDMATTVEEMQRLLDKGIRGFTLSDRPELLGLPELSESYFDPMWDIFNESGAVVNFHVAGGATKTDLNQAIDDMIKAETRTEKPFNPDELREIPARAPDAWWSLSPQRRHVPFVTVGFMSNVRIISNLCLSNLFDRYPKLKIASIESGIGWAPYILESMEYQFDEFVTSADELAFAKRRPTEYFHDHIYLTTWFEQASIERSLDVIGVKNVLLETDVPHAACVFPDARAHFDRMLTSCDEATVRRLTFENAAELFRIQDHPLLQVD